MTEPAELFALLTCELEEMHGLTVEGQQSGQPPEINAVLVHSIRVGLIRCDALLRRLDDAV
ncbi:hypothetical protein [Erythrobacter sp. YT30]|uniref:hypothetical protein n=1 Tax=Erythrobacter sp. YT30 TaxID=1735012 RepID=UPI00076D26D5|nr:hypothetical protein [Erythrobacter sp. YT30]KWV91737.1 hypothetical protein AUC45_11065 [Erythrobacter sp. YT30]